MTLVVVTSYIYSTAEKTAKQQDGKAAPSHGFLKGF